MTINITGNPGTPSFGDPANFNSEAQAFFDWLTDDGATGFIGQLESIDAADYFSVTAFMQTVLLAANAAAARTTLGAQAQDAHLDDLAGLSAVSAAAKFMMSTAAGTWAYKDIVGTVSQSGGTVTGALIEEGSNANGEYTKFADGTMICWHTYDAGSITAEGSGTYASPYSTAVVTVNFPVTFAAAPTVAAAGASPAATAISRGLLPEWSGVNTGGIINMRLRKITSNADSSDGFLYYIAAGRWF